MRTITSKPRGEFQLRYLECKLCGVRCRCERLALLPHSV